MSSGSLYIATTPVTGNPVFSLEPQTTVVDPLTCPDDVISNHIIGIHNSQAPRRDVESLYHVVKSIVTNATKIGDYSPHLKRTKSIELVEDKVPQSSFLPSYSMLKEVACELTCKPFSASTAHQTVVGILGKLQNYTWDAKVVIALTAFALDYEESSRLYLTAPHKENTLELHVFKFGKEEKPSHDEDLVGTLVEFTFQLIEGIAKIESLVADKAYSQKDVPALFDAPRELYTYWAIFALLTCACRTTQLEWNVKSDVIPKLMFILTQLKADLEKINQQIAIIDDLIWRYAAFRTPPGILELLKALIFPKDIQRLEIFDNSAAKNLVEPEVLKTKNLLLFISGLDNIDDKISALKSVHDSLTTDKDKQDYKILWVPVVKEWNDEEREKFGELLKNKMPAWYVVHYFSLIKGFKPLQEVWKYQGKPIVVVTNPRGKVLNYNAMHMILVWGIQAFPFGPKDDPGINWNWFWNAAFKISPDIEKWVNQEKMHIFFYGGTDKAWTQKFGNIVDDVIKRDGVIKSTNTLIEQLNLGKIDPALELKFWNDICNSFLSTINQKDNKDIGSLLSKISEKGWALLSHKKNVLVLGYSEAMMNVVERFNDWKKNVESQDFGSAFLDYYSREKGKFPRHCVNIPLNNILSGVPDTIDCPDPSCKRQMEIDFIVNYNCCHGMHSDSEHATQDVDSLFKLRKIINNGLVDHIAH